MRVGELLAPVAVDEVEGEVEAARHPAAGQHVPVVDDAASRSTCGADRRRWRRAPRGASSQDGPSRIPAWASRMPPVQTDAIVDAAVVQLLQAPASMPSSYCARTPPPRTQPPPGTMHQVGAVAHALGALRCAGRGRRRSRPGPWAPTSSTSTSGCLTLTLLEDLERADGVDLVEAVEDGDLDSHAPHRRGGAGCPPVAGMP